MKITTDHQEIRQWAEERDAIPVIIQGVVGNRRFEDIRLYFPEQRNEPVNYQRITWKEFFEKFEQKNLALEYQENTNDEERSLIYHLVGRQQTGPLTL